MSRPHGLVAVSAITGLLFASACAVDHGDEAQEASDVAAAGSEPISEVLASHVIYSAKLSETASLDVAMDDEGRLVTNLAGSSDKDMDLFAKAAGILENPPSEVIQALTGQGAPVAITDAQAAIAKALRDAPEAAQAAPISGSDARGALLELLPGTQPLAFRGGSERFYGLYCSGTEAGYFPGTYPQTSNRYMNRRCRGHMDRHPNPYVQISENAYGHVMSVAAENHAARFRTYYWGCKFLSCAYRKIQDEKIDPGSWRYSSHYADTAIESRRVRVDAWNESEKGVAVVHTGMTYHEPCIQPMCLVNP